MLPNIVDDFEGELWIDFEDGVCKVNVSVQFPEVNADKKAELISIAKDQKNAAAVGIVGKIRNAIENFFLDEDMMTAATISTRPYSLATGYSDGVRKFQDYAARLYFMEAVDSPEEESDS